MKKIILAIFSIFIVAMVTLPTFASAEKGDFYDDNKKKIDERFDGDKDAIKFIKAYDPSTNNFDCGITEISCHVMGTYYEMALGFANFVSQGTKVLVLEPDAIVKDKAFTTYKGYLKDLSTIMLSTFLLWQVIILTARRFGDPDDYPQALNGKIFSVVAGALFLGLYEIIFSNILEIQHMAVSAILESGLDKKQLYLMIFLNSPDYSIVYGFFVGIVMIVFLIALIYRYVAFGFFYVVGPVAIPTIVNEEFNYFNVWLKAIVNNLVTLFCQSICFALALSAMLGKMNFVEGLPGYGVQTVVGFLLALVFCFFALAIPSILGNLGASTGTARSLTKVVRYSMMRR
jgi:hypothetical protein